MANATKLEIFNRALILIGSRTMVADDEDSREGNALNAIWDMVRRELMESHDWNFALRRDTLTHNTFTDPDWAWEYGFDLPIDYRKMLRISHDINYQPEIPYMLKRGTVLETPTLNANFTPIYIEYISNETDVTKFPALIGYVLAVKLAIEVANLLTEDKGKLDRLEARYTEALMKAKSEDALPDGQKFIQPVGWQYARRGRWLGGYPDNLNQV